MKAAKSFGLTGDKARASAAQLVREQTGVDCIKLLGLNIEYPNDSYSSNQDSFDAFFNECCFEVAQKSGWATSKQIYDAYCDWCVGSGYSAMTKKNFRMILLSKYSECRVGYHSIRCVNNVALIQKYQ